MKNVVCMKNVAEAHRLLSLTLDLISDNNEDWTAVFDNELVPLVHTINAIVPRWKDPAADGYVARMHYLLDMCFRYDNETIPGKLAEIRGYLNNKIEYGADVLSLSSYIQDVRDDLTKSGGHLDPDTANPLQALEEAMIAFDIRVAQNTVREMARADKYSYQRHVTHTHPKIIELNKYLYSDGFRMWMDDTSMAICGPTNKNYFQMESRNIKSQEA